MHEKRNELSAERASIRATRARRKLSTTVRHSKRHNGRGNPVLHALRSTAAPLPPRQAGELINQYELIRELGRGAMGQVFLARDTRLNRQVAIKFFDENAYDVGERFLVEARATARCKHENIISIYEVSEHQGHPFLVLEYLDGAPLSECIGQGPMPPEQAISLILPVVRALVCAHAAGIVHRDLKPENIFVTARGTIKVLDFGIAKIMAGAGAATRETGQERATVPAVIRLTSRGTVLGTMPYMSPEQWRRDHHLVDHRADIWAVGILLFEMLYGAHPLAPLTHERLSAIAAVDEPMPSVAEVLPDVPGALARIIDDCLRKPLSERLGSARALLARLEALQPGSAQRRPGQVSGQTFGQASGELEAPYPGLVPFGEADAHRFFGRFAEVARTAMSIRTTPLVFVAGLPAVGKTSFVRAGLVPALQAAGEPWEVLALTPGDTPLTNLASLLAEILDSTEASGTADERIQLVLGRLREDPDYLPAVLHRHARQRAGQVLLFVDQLEQLHTMPEHAEERAVFTACLTRMADCAGLPVRAVVAIRSDVLAQAAERNVFFRRFSQSAEILAPFDRASLEQALVQPAAMLDHVFESRALIDEVLDTVTSAPAVLPCLQRVATHMWEARDRVRRVLTRDSFAALGPVAGHEP